MGRNELADGIVGIKIRSGFLRMLTNLFLDDETQSIGRWTYSALWHIYIYTDIVVSFFSVAVIFSESRRMQRRWTSNLAVEIDRLSRLLKDFESHHLTVTRSNIKTTDYKYHRRTDRRHWTKPPTTQSRKYILGAANHMSDQLRICEEFKRLV